MKEQFIKFMPVMDEKEKKTEGRFLESLQKEMNELRKRL